MLNVFVEVGWCNLIGFIRGIILEKDAPFILIDVNGIGYELQAPMTTFFQLPPVNGSVMLYAHFSVSENAQQLFGFASKKDRDLFRLLIKVSGVGPKMAIGILSMESNDFVRCVMEDNITKLTKVPGVGKKTAERLLIEMRDKLKAWQPAPIFDAHSSNGDPDSLTSHNDWISEAESALVALGYKPIEASKSVSRAMRDDIKSSEELIRAALKSMIAN